MYIIVYHIGADRHPFPPPPPFPFLSTHLSFPLPIMRKMYNLYKQVKEKLARFSNLFLQKSLQKHYWNNLSIFSRRWSYIKSVNWLLGRIGKWGRGKFRPLFEKDANVFMFRYVLYWFLRVLSKSVKIDAVL